MGASAESWGDAMNEHTHKQFDTEMEAVRSGVLAMGGLVESQLTRAIAVLDEEEEIDAIDQVGADEKTINQMQVNLDQMCSQIIARRQPTAIDLRFVLMITKIVNELERTGDVAEAILEHWSEHPASTMADARVESI